MTALTTTARLQELLVQLHAGQEAAREGLIEHSLERLRCLTRKMFHKQADLREFDQTDDVLNKALVRLYQALAHVRPETVRAYYAIAANQIRWVLRDLAREHGKRRITYVGDAPERPDFAEEPADLLEWSEFHEAIERLPETERELFNLLLYEGLEQAEAATLMDMPLRTLKRRWQRARLLLLDMLQGKEGA